MRQLVTYTVLHVLCKRVALRRNTHKKSMSGKVQTEGSAQMCDTILDSTIPSSALSEQHSKSQLIV